MPFFFLPFLFWSKSEKADTCKGKKRVKAFECLFIVYYGCLWFLMEDSCWRIFSFPFFPYNFFQFSISLAFARREISIFISGYDSFLGLTSTCWNFRSPEWIWWDLFWYREILTCWLQLVWFHGLSAKKRWGRRKEKKYLLRLGGDLRSVTWPTLISFTIDLKSWLRAH